MSETLREGVERVLTDSCHHCGRMPEADGDHTCLCSVTDSECLTHAADPVVSRDELRALLAEPAPKTRDEASRAQVTFTAEDVIRIANETSDSLGNLYRLDFIDRIRYEAEQAEPAPVADEGQAAGLGGCPTECDDDCEAPCHEGHQVYAKQEHDPIECESGLRQVGEIELAEGVRILGHRRHRTDRDRMASLRPWINDLIAARGATRDGGAS